MPTRSLAKFSWAILGFTLGVVLWGAYVRATGSGAGCGEHWPLCNGQVIPRAPQIQTVIEFVHRLTSGLNLIGVIWLAVLFFRRLPQGALARQAAACSVIFIFSEALVGAGLVLFGWVAGNQSGGRAIALAVHLINTFLLLAAVTLAADWSSRPALRFKRSPGGAGALSLLLALAVGVSGAVAALGDTLFPSADLSQGLAADFSSASHFLLRLRVFHPLLAVVAIAWLLTYSARKYSEAAPGASRVRTRALALGGLSLLQAGLGFLNLALLAPVWTQIAHLAVADLIWITLVLLVSESMLDAPTEESSDCVPSFEPASLMK